MDFIRQIRTTTIAKVDPQHVRTDRAIRVYCEQSRTRWNLQVRGPSTKVNGRDGADFIVATATCSADDLRALRDAIDKLLAE